MTVAELLVPGADHLPYVYPFAELWTGLGMMSLIGTGSTLIWLMAPVGILIGTINAISGC
ncbi:hypothetical protein [uncultured Sulfitobacter sp.]|uniref:hypothetical protein n=1 Tax=uncultured Sulfitobacter sp. TaxID=191468 RepID=UPI002633887E|nr:hypothetical protein [uncultured Sulfitobacter sp.]